MSPPRRVLSTRHALLHLFFHVLLPLGRRPGESYVDSSASSLRAHAFIQALLGERNGFLSPPSQQKRGEAEYKTPQTGLPSWSSG